VPVLVWSEAALADLADIIDSIRQSNPRAAERVRSKITKSGRFLSEFPLAGRRGTLVGVREWLGHPRYLIMYRFDDATVTIISVIHTARDRG
jgi:toxin ParE1/3/4